MKNINHNDSSSENVESGKMAARPEYVCNLLVSVIAHLSHDIEADEDDFETDPLQQLLDGALGEFPHCDVIESFIDEGVCSTAANGWKAEKFESLNVIAEVWTKVQITVPFNPTGKLSLSQQRFIHRNAAELLSEMIDAEYESHVTDAGVWLADDAGEPTVFLTGMFDVMEGRLTERKLKRYTANAWEAIPSKLLGSDQTE